MTSAAAARKPRERPNPAKARTGSSRKEATTPIVNIAVAKAHLPELVERAAGGEIIVLARAGKPMARLMPLDDDRRALRVPGKGKGRFRMAADFDAPLADDVLALFEGRGT